MLKVLILGLSVVAIAAESAPRTVALSELTIPSERLPAGCALLQENPAATGQVRSVPVPGTTHTLILSAARIPEFPTNPWIGSDRRLMASIRGRIDGPALVPDGPPLNARELSRYQDQLANGVEEAYGAVYGPSATEAVTVRAVRFAPGEKPAARAWDGTRAPRNLATARVTLGPVLATVTGHPGACFEAIAAHLHSLAN